MKKSIVLVSLVGTLALAACGPAASAPKPPVTEPTVPATNESQRGAQALIGSWRFTSTAQLAFSGTLKLSRVLDSASRPGEYFAAGEDAEGNVAVGWYDPRDRRYVVASGPDTLTRFFEFPNIAADGSVSGIMWLSYGNGTYSEDFSMIGQRVLPTASLQAGAVATPDRRTAEQLLDKAHAAWERSKR